jgi:hypothetical protein
MDESREDLRAVDIHRHIYAAVVKCDDVNEQHAYYVPGLLPPLAYLATMAASMVTLIAHPI